VQINIANIDPTTGVSNKTHSTFGICGFIRGHAEGDEAIAALVKKADAAVTV